MGYTEYIYPVYHPRGNGICGAAEAAVTQATSCARERCVNMASRSLAAT
jgi:hypothetical protein